MSDMSNNTATIKKHMMEAKRANTHQARLTLLVELLRELFGVELEELIPGIETKIEARRLRADLIFSNVVFEVKVDLKRELEDAMEQLKKYLQALYDQEPERRSIGIATDAIEFKAYIPVIKDGKVIYLKEIGSINIGEADPEDTILWLDSFIFSQPEIRPSAQDLRCRFGPGSPTYSIAIEELHRLWSEVESERDVKLKLDLWAKNMEIVYGSKPELSSFIEHTYLVTLVKLIVYLMLSEDRVVGEEGIRRALTGEYFSSYGITNLIEEDFFAWITHPRIFSDALKLVRGIAKELLRYDFSKIDEDFFKEIYQEIVGRGERHRIGEYYTPEWLVQLILKEVVDLWKNEGFPRILDPACGSGAFLCNAIHMAKEKLKGWQQDQILDFIINNVVGVDVNPLATIIARANYLLALGDLVKSGKRITIPVYVADSIRIPKVSMTLTAGGDTTVYEVYVNGHTIRIPESLVTRRDTLSQVLEAFKDATSTYRERVKRDEALNIFKGKAPKLSNDESEILEDTLGTLMTLMDEGLDTIWIFILSNIYAPIMLMESGFDAVVGNPPWIAMRYIENRNYQDFLKKQVLAYGLLESDQVHLFTHMEAATLFFCRSSDLYLRDGGLIAFVMPRSVLTGAFHHENFRKFRKPRMKLLKIIDLEDVSPLFNVPSCVLIAVKDGETKYPVPAEKYAGKLPKKNVKLEEIEHLAVSGYMYEPPAIPVRYSFYHNKVKAGATIIPRAFWFIDFDVHPKLGINIHKPRVRTAGDVPVKDPWGVKLEGNIEADFIYATLLGGDIVPFGYHKLRPVILPIEPTSNGYRLLDVDDLRNKGFTYTADWLNKAQGFWSRNATKRSLKGHPRIILRLNYMGNLSSQDPNKRYIVLYNASGTNLVSCVIDKKCLPTFRVPVDKQPDSRVVELAPRGFIAETKTYFYETDDEMEAHYLCAILNSNVVNGKIKPLQPRGLFGERDIHRRPFMLPIPKFNGNEESHIKLAELSKACHAKVASLKFTRKGTAGLRKEARKAVEEEIDEIDELVSRLGI
ncbi:MAG: N-6 DNA methylase [Candidatus Korarchaeum sp.]